MKGKDFPQVVVRTEAGISLVTTEGIAEWLTHQIEDDIISISETILNDVIPHEISNSYLFMGANKTVDHVRRAFEKSIESKKARLYCILITNNGKMSDNLQGIVTPWDIIEQNQNSI